MDSRRLVSLRNAASVVAACVMSVNSGLPALQSPTEISSRGAPEKETAFGNLVADAIAKAADAPIALAPASSTRPGVIPAGFVTLTQALPLLANPHDKIVVSMLTGDQLKRALERSFLVAPKPNRGFLHVSGLQVKVDVARSPGSRVIAVERKPKAPLAAADKVPVAMPQSLGVGGLGYFEVFGSPNITRKLPITLKEALNAFLQQAVTIDYSKETRLVKP